MDHGDLKILRDIKEKIDRIEEAAEQLKNLGQGVPAIEKNAVCVLSAVHNLKFAISDIVDVQES